MSSAGDVSDRGVGAPPRRRAARWWAFASGNLGLVLGLGGLTIIVLLAVCAPLLAPHDPYAQDLLRRLAPPVWQDGGSWTHPLGTDNLGRDYLSRLLYGGRVSLLIGVSVALISGVIGSVLGLLAGYFRGWTDAAISLLVTVRLALPVILVALAVAALVGNSLTVLIVVLGFLRWDRFVVVVRATTLQVSSLDYVMAARASGASTLRILCREVFPNVANNLLVIATVEASAAILLEAALSFLGLGVQPPIPSWGLMIAEAKPFLFFSPWLITLPGSLIAVLVLCINLFGDGLRDYFSPDRRT